MERKKYYGIDWLRAFACIGIMLMHMAANTDYAISGYVYDIIIPSFTNFTFLFMTVSAFGMCCGYYDKVMSGNVDWVDFYKKRYMKILPFYACLIFIDLIMELSKSSLIEGIADLTLLYGLFPNDITVIGVGWFLGLVFAFYLIFPFFCVLISTKKRAWISFGISLVMNYLCGTYFELGRSNIVYSLCFFLIGGLIYQYRDDLMKLKSSIAILAVVISAILYYLIGGNTITCLLVSAVLVIAAITYNGGKQTAIAFISGISMEFYLSHMVIFRVVEKLHIPTMFGDGVLQYIITCIVVLIGTICFAFVAQKIIAIVMRSISGRLNT